MSRMSQWMAVGFSTWFTWLIYRSNTLAGTEAQADMVPWIVWILFLAALFSLGMANEALIKLRPKTPWLKVGADINILAQGFLLLVTGHWLLALVRVSAEVIIRGKVNYAHSEMVWRGGSAFSEEARQERERNHLPGIR